LNPRGQIVDAGPAAAVVGRSDYNRMGGDLADHGLHLRVGVLILEKLFLLGERVDSLVGLGGRFLDNYDF